MKKTFRVLLLAGVLLVNARAYSQRTAIILTGTVTDATHHPLPGVSIKNKCTGAGVSTNEQGTFIITVNSVPVRLEFSHIGYATVVKHFITGDTVILQKAGVTGNEVVVAASRLQGSNLHAQVPILSGAAPGKADSWLGRLLPLLFPLFPVIAIPRT